MGLRYETEKGTAILTPSPLKGHNIQQNVHVKSGYPMIASLSREAAMKRKDGLMFIQARMAIDRLVDDGALGFIVFLLGVLANAA